MKKKYITIATLFLLLIAAVLTRISDVKEEVVITQTEISDIKSSTTTNMVDVIETTKQIDKKSNNGNMGPGVFNNELNEKTWSWIQTTYNDGKIIKSKNTDKFKLTFKNIEDGKTFSATTDCNGVGGEYMVNGKSIKFDKMISTMMYCENSQEQEFIKSLNDVVGYFFTDKNELVLELKYDSGSMIFR